MTLDGFCDHTAGIADDEIHQHYKELLSSADAVVYGRITYQLMEFWETVVKNPTGNKAMDEFAVTMDNIPDKVVFSRTLKNVGWRNARVAKQSVKDELWGLKQQEGKNILVGSPSLIVACLNLDLVDEYQFCVHPVILGKGLPLFKNINDKIDLGLIKTKTFGCGAVALYYKPIKR